MLPCKICIIFHKNIFAKHLRKAASENRKMNEAWKPVNGLTTAEKFSIKDFFSKCDQILRRICAANKHLKRVSILAEAPYEFLFHIKFCSFVQLLEDVYLTWFQNKMHYIRWTRFTSIKLCLLQWKTVSTAVFLFIKWSCKISWHLLF